MGVYLLPTENLFKRLTRVNSSKCLSKKKKNKWADMRIMLMEEQRHSKEKKSCYCNNAKIMDLRTLGQ